VPKRNLSNLSSERRSYSTSKVEEIKTPRISKSDVLGKKGLVQRLSMGFEQLEQNAKETQIQLGAEGRYVLSECWLNHSSSYWVSSSHQDRSIS